jgi:hypothetical protein
LIHAQHPIAGVGMGLSEQPPHLLGLILLAITALIDNWQITRTPAKK